MARPGNAEIDVSAGDLITVIDNGGCFTTYRELAEQCKLTRYHHGNTALCGAIYKVLKKAKHTTMPGTYNEILCIEDIGTRKQYLIENGFLYVRIFKKGIIQNEFEF